MTAEDVKKVTFERGVRGYRPEDVDDFLAQTARAMEELEAECDAALAAKADMESKMMILAQKVEEYRAEENTLKTALINAQRMGETVVHEAKQKADSILRDATGQTEFLRQQAEHDVKAEQTKLVKMKDEVVHFKDTILNLYKQHIESLSAIDDPIDRAEDYLAANTEQPVQPALEEEAAVEGVVEEEVLIAEPEYAPAVDYAAEGSSVGDILSDDAIIIPGEAPAAQPAVQEEPYYPQEEEADMPAPPAMDLFEDTAPLPAMPEDAPESPLTKPKM